MPQPKSSKFKVIVVGGGPVGLTAAHIFAKAGIEFLVLERGKTVFPDLGASVGLSPSTLRVMNQLGLLDTLMRIGVPIFHGTTYTDEGKLVHERNFPTKEMHGYYATLFHRAELLEALYDQLPEIAKTRIHTDKKVAQIKDFGSGVRVICEDGSSYSGSILLGADGVNSGVRQLIDEYALKETPNVAKKTKFQASYKVMFGNLPRIAEFEPSNLFESHGQGHSSQLFVGRERMWFFIYKKLDQPTAEKKRFTQDDVEAYGEEMADIHVTEKLLFRDIFKLRNNAGLTNLEEGIAEHWSWKRMVLVGDSAHKVTPNLGWGYNSGVTDLVILINLLRPLLAAYPNGEIETKDIENVFSKYRSDRIQVVNTIVSTSGMATRMSAWNSPSLYYLDRYLFPILKIEYYLGRYLVGPIISALPVLDFLEEKHRQHGMIPWISMPKVLS